jgi:hypothetical protein
MTIDLTTDWRHNYKLSFFPDIDELFLLSRPLVKKVYKARAISFPSSLTPNSCQHLLGQLAYCLISRLIFCFRRLLMTRPIYYLCIN